MKVEVLVAPSCPTLWDPMDCSLPGSSVHGILQARILELVAISFSRESSQPRDWTPALNSWVSCLAGRFFLIWATREAHIIYYAVFSRLLCPTLCDPMYCRPPGSSAHGVSPGKTTGIGCHFLLQGIFPTQGSNPPLSLRRWILDHLSHQRNPIISHNCMQIYNYLKSLIKTPFS